jgi:hypothetical protein
MTRLGTVSECSFRGCWVFHLYGKKTDHGPEKGLLRGTEVLQQGNSSSDWLIDRERCFFHIDCHWTEI